MGLYSSNTQGCPGASTAPLLKAVQGPPQLQYSRLSRGLHSSTPQGCPGASTCLNPVLAIPVVEHRLEQEIAQWVHIVHFRSKLKVEGNLSAKSTLWIRAKLFLTTSHQSHLAHWVSRPAVSPLWITQWHTECFKTVTIDIHFNMLFSTFYSFNRMLVISFNMLRVCVCVCVCVCVTNNGILFPISSKGSFICTIPQTG